MPQRQPVIVNSLKQLIDFGADYARTVDASIGTQAL